MTYWIIILVVLFTIVSDLTMSLESLHQIYLDTSNRVLDSMDFIYKVKLMADEFEQNVSETSESEDESKRFQTLQKQFQELKSQYMNFNNIRASVTVFGPNAH